MELEDILSLIEEIVGSGKNLQDINADLEEKIKPLYLSLGLSGSREFATRVGKRPELMKKLDEIGAWRKKNDRR